MNDEIVKCCQKFLSVQDSYCGDKTDWHEKYQELFQVHSVLVKLPIRRSEYYRSYEWMRRALKKAVSDEQQRVAKLAGIWGA